MFKHKYLITSQLRDRHVYLASSQYLNRFLELIERIVNFEVCLINYPINQLHIESQCRNPNWLPVLTIAFTAFSLYVEHCQYQRTARRTQNKNNIHMYIKKNKTKLKLKHISAYIAHVNSLSKNGELQMYFQVLLKRNRMRGTFPDVVRTPKTNRKARQKWKNENWCHKKKITNKQTSENIYKPIRGEGENNKNGRSFYFILHAVDLAASSIAASASVFPSPTTTSNSNTNSNNISEYNGNCIMCSDLNRINARLYIEILRIRSVCQHKNIS